MKDDLDSSFLDDALSDEAIEEVTEEVEAEEVEAQPEEAEAAEAEEAPEASKEPEEDPRDKELAGIKIALAEARGELRSYKAQQQPQQQAVDQRPVPVTAPDVIDDQGGFVAAVSQHASTVAENAARNAALKTSRFLAEKDHGKDVVDAAFAYFDENPQETAQFVDHPSPFHAAVEVYKQKQVLQEMQGDPEAFRQKLKAEVMAELKAEEVAKNVGRVDAPASLANKPNLGSRSAPSWGGPASLDDILGG